LLRRVVTFSHQPVRENRIALLLSVGLD